MADILQEARVLWSKVRMNRYRQKLSFRSTLSSDIYRILMILVPINWPPRDLHQNHEKPINIGQPNGTQTLFSAVPIRASNTLFKIQTYVNGRMLFKTRRLADAQ